MTRAMRAAVFASAIAAAASAVSAQDPHPTFSVGTATAKRGEKALGVLKVPAGSDAGYDIPVAVIHGAKPGPVLAVVSGAHGTEYASILAVEQLIDGRSIAGRDVGHADPGAARERAVVRADRRRT